MFRKDHNLTDCGTTKTLFRKDHNLTDCGTTKTLFRKDHNLTDCGTTKIMFRKDHNLNEDSKNNSVIFAKPGAVRNADRKCKAFSLRSKIWFPRVGNQIWVSTPQNRTYRAWGELELPISNRLWYSKDLVS